MKMNKKMNKEMSVCAYNHMLVLVFAVIPVWIKKNGITYP